jgi:hypothetical protein
MEMKTCKQCKQTIPEWEDLCFYCKRKKDREPKEKIEEWFINKESKDLFTFLNGKKHENKKR